jgi:hypothetical protein
MPANEGQGNIGGDVNDKEDEMEVEWVEELPKQKAGRRGGGGKYTAALEALRERPGVWAVLTKGNESNQKAHNQASNLRLGKVALPPGRYEYASRGTTVYARYIGEEK